MYYIRVTDEKKSFPSHNILGHSQGVYKFEDTGSRRSQEICDRNFGLRERKWTNKSNDKKEVADSLLHNI